MKYILKNCDNYTDISSERTCCSTIQNRKGNFECKNVEDCLLKQIVKFCQMNMDDSDFRYILQELNKEGVDVWQSTSNIAIIKILRLLEIEEVK